MPQHIVARAADLPPGTRKLININRSEIGLFNIDGQFFAVLNICPHQAGPVCLGTIDGTTLPSQPYEYHWSRNGEILRCPWHSWEFELKTGRALFDPHIALKTYPVEVRDGQIIVSL